MASLLLEYRDSWLRRAALEHAVAEVLRTQGDRPVLRAIELAPDLTVARAIRHAAEAACEAVSTSSHGVERQTRLFSIAVVVRFAEPLTERDLGDHLAPIVDTPSLLARVQESGDHHCARSVIWPHIWAFDDLSRLSFSEVRQRTITASSASVARNGRMILPFPPSTSAQRRCATFLRYLVGYRVGSEATLARGHGARFADCVRSVMRASLSAAQDMAVTYDGRFYGPLWQGLRVYQGYRIADVVEVLAARGINAPELAASVALTGSRNKIGARIAFLRGGKRLDQHLYRILLEPQADPTCAVARVIAPLRSLGVKVHTKREAAAATFGSCDELERGSRVARRFELTLPL